MGYYDDDRVRRVPQMAGRPFAIFGSTRTFQGSEREARAHLKRDRHAKVAYAFTPGGARKIVKGANDHFAHAGAGSRKFGATPHEIVDNSIYRYKSSYPTRDIDRITAANYYTRPAAAKRKTSTTRKRKTSTTRKRKTSTTRKRASKDSAYLRW